MDAWFTIRFELSQRNIPIVYTFTEESGNEEFWKERRKVEKEYKQFGENSPLVNAVGLFVGRKNNINALQAIIYKQDGSGKLMPFQTLDTTPAADGKTSNYYMTTATVENESVHSREMFNHAMAMLQSEVRSKAISERISSIRTWNDKHHNIFDFADKAVMPKTSKPDVINYPFGTSSNEQ